MGLTPDTFPRAVDAVFDLACDNLAKDGFIAETLTGFDTAGTPAALVMSGADLDVEHARARMGERGLVLPHGLGRAARPLLRAHLSLHQARAAIYVAHLSGLPESADPTPLVAVVGTWPEHLALCSRMAVVAPSTAVVGGRDRAVVLPDEATDVLTGVEAWLTSLLA